MRSAVTTFRPASIIVANCRENTCSDLAFTRFMKLRVPAWPLAVSPSGVTLLSALPVLPPLPADRSSSNSARSPRTRSCSRAAASVGACTSPVSSRPSALIAVKA